MIDWNEIRADMVAALIPVIIPALTGLISAAIGCGITYLKAQTQSVKKEIARKTFEAALIEAEIVGIDAVKATSQKFVEHVKKESANGKLTTDEIHRAMLMARGYFIKHISRQSLDVLEAARGPVNVWLEDFLEAKVHDVKNSKAKEIQFV